MIARGYGGIVMGHIIQDVRIRADKARKIRMLVDTGATFSIISDRLARTIGIRPTLSAWMTLADGRRVRVHAGTAVFRIGDREAPATLLVGDVVEPILGVGTLEVLGLKIDPRREKLIP